jgi:hypothetical protein
VGFVLEYVALTQPTLARATKAALWSAVPWTLATAVATADWRARAIPSASSRLEAIWFWFRDHWGVVWALRVLERFNRAAEAQRWPIRLTWHGVVATADGAPAVPSGAEATLKTLLRRFAEPGPIDAVADNSCRRSVDG